MRKCGLGLFAILAILIASSSCSYAQANPAQAGRGRGAQTPQAAQPKPSTEPFDPHDFSGIWILRTPYAGISNKVPPLTEWGKAKYDLNKPSYGPKAVPPALGNDVIGNCDPTGFPRN